MNEESDSENTISSIVQFSIEEGEVYQIKNNENGNRIVQVSVTSYSNISDYTGINFIEGV